MASRPVHFFWILDTSYSMGVNGKIGALNFAIKEALPEMRAVAKDNPAASLMVRALTFSTSARWQQPTSTPVDDFHWQDVQPDGITNLGEALKLVARELEMPPMPERALKPVLALVSDGQPTDDWRSGLRAVDATPWGKRAVRVSIGIGEDVDRAMLKEFLANPELEPFDANSPKQLAAAIRWASTVAVKAASTPVAAAADNKTLGGGYAPYAPPTVTTADDDDDVW
ncbi:VWA domain-containing protein [Streptomyces sp. NBC_00620]|uniref:vWA domain-containing protein n=1 Tax=unclassified Streptomyces TaxID=2593676 RepID=UPI002255384D|nr:VWA domain-containing protein [Streptomyces sp. NBC_00620]MCX4978327.1 VWA domain-containing protein [Streptomyces sp. NBC_00620]WUC16824.1 VWA domain-containing protein [Streptomyces sp. NBC_00564]WUC55075.1 VWA domain-containing protein [Streptomyces sp. NBC_00554]